MPKWARLKTTSNSDLRDRMASVVENGYGDEGPLAKGCCLSVLLFPLIVTAGGIIWFLMWLGSVVY